MVVVVAVDEIEIYEKIKHIISDKTKLDNEIIVKDTKLFEDLSIDILDMLEIIIDIEEKFNIELLEKFTDNIVMVEDIVKLVKNILDEEKNK